MSRPLIAVGTYRLPFGVVSPWQAEGYGVQAVYMQALWRAGLRAVLLPFPDPDGTWDLSMFDGLLMVGGSDLAPSSYGAETLDPSIYGVDSLRDTQDLGLARAALAGELPALCVCRGMQALNVAAGGTLIADLPSLGGMHRHGFPTGGEMVTHGVDVVPATRLAKAMGGAERVEQCESVHHQAVDVLGEGLIVSAWADDGVIEAIEPEDPDRTWLLGVQWHPERNADVENDQQALFDAFAYAVKENCQGGSR